MNATVSRNSSFILYRFTAVLFSWGYIWTRKSPKTVQFEGSIMESEDYFDTGRVGCRLWVICSSCTLLIFVIYINTAMMVVCAVKPVNKTTLWYFILLLHKLSCKKNIYITSFAQIFLPGSFHSSSLCYNSLTKKKKNRDWCSHHDGAKKLGILSLLGEHHSIFLYLPSRSTCLCYLQLQFYPWAEEEEKKTSDSIQNNYDISECCVLCGIPGPSRSLTPPHLREFTWM